MKIRWTQQSLRLRITPTELAALTAFEAISEEIRFPGGSSWSITVVRTTLDSVVESENGNAVLHLSNRDFEHFSNPDVEGYYTQMENGEPLRVSIEKDFPCVHPRASEAAEPPAETFEPPPGFNDRKTTPQL